MTVSDPTLLPPGADTPEGAVARVEWFERKVGEWTLQAKLPAFHIAETDEWFVGIDHWTKWGDEMVAYFIHNGHTGPEIDAFIQNHALSGG